MFMAEMVNEPHQSLFGIKNSECAGKVQTLIISGQLICTRQNPHLNVSKALILLAFSKKVWICKQL